MIENYLIEHGLGCGTVLNFKKEILKNLKLGITDRWYFKTPVKVLGNGLKSASLDMVFPFRALLSDNVNDEKTVLTRLEIVRKGYEDGLLNFFRTHKFIVPPDTANFSIIPFWADGSNYREELQDFAGIRVHILNATITVKYRNLELVETADAELIQLQTEQLEIERKIDLLTVYSNSPEFDLLPGSEQTLITDQLTAMNTYNDCLKSRILLI